MPFRNLVALMFLHHVIGILLWGVLPIVALALVFRALCCRWILVALFGCRGVAATCYLVWLACTHPLVPYTWLYLVYILDAAFYLGSAVWLLFSGGA